MTPTWTAEMPQNRHKKCVDAYDRAATRAKRLKLQHDNSPEPSTISSEDSAIMPTRVPDTTAEVSDCESDVSSELSESSEDPSDDSSDEDSEDDNAMDEYDETVVNVRANRGQKPVMRLAGGDLGDDIRPFLKEFLPKLKAANEELAAKKAAGTLETAEVDEKEDGEGEGESEGQYIELNLGLGVLEAKDSDASDSPDSEDEEKDRDDTKTGDKDVLGKLMGRENTQPTASIQVVEEKTESA